MKILVLGAGGMAGHLVTTYLKEKNYDVTGLSAKNKLDDSTVIMDVTDSEGFLKFLTANSFDVVINCAGVLIQQSEDRKDLASYINAYLPHQLEQFYKDTPTKVIHLSTDCVFSGKNAPYTETSKYDGESFYDRSKALGEIINEKDLTFRMSIVGPDKNSFGTGLFNWFFAQTGEIGGYTNAVWSGVTTIVLARAIESAIRQDITGLYHLTPKKNISKHDLLVLFKDVFGRSDITIKPVKTEPVDKTLINTRDDFDFTIEDYPTMIRDMKNWIQNHKDLYKLYEKQP